MSLNDAFRLLLRYWLLLLLIPLVLAGSIFFFTRNQKKNYTSDTTIYTGIASGYTIKGNTEADFYATSNAFDNLLTLINSRETKEAVAFRLLATHLMLKNADPTLLAWNSYVHLQELVPPALRAQLVAPTLEGTIRNIQAYTRANSTNAIYKLLNSEEPYYSLGALSAIVANRITSSDLLRIEYTTTDPAICKHTLMLLTQVFISNYRNLRERQTESVIGYFEAQTKQAQKRLADAERKFLDFNKSNNIINYDEQTKNISSEKEALDANYNEVNMQYAGAQSALNAVNRKLAGRGAALLSSNEMVEQRNHLVQLQAKIADQQLFTRQQEGATSAQRTSRLQAEADQTAKNIQRSVDNYYTQSNSVEGIPSKDLLNEWVRNTILVEENKAKLRVMDKHKREFEVEYRRMAPLGATLKGIEREIDLAEKAYLSLLSSLNESRASQQSNQITANLKIVDQPYLPLRPAGSKRLLLVLLGLVGGFVFTASGVLASGLLDHSLRKASRASDITGIPVAGVFPDHNSRKALPASYEQRSTDHLIRHILLKANTRANQQTFVVAVVSLLSAEDSSQLSQALSQRAYTMGLATLALYPQGSKISEATGPDMLYYPAETAAVQGWKLDGLTRHHAADAQLVLVSFPALLEATYPVAVLRQVDLVLLALRANQTWQEADRKTVDGIRAATSAPVEVVLVGVEPYDAEETIGKIGSHHL
jgi:succinoglycan biosynthesis transport protein ExoP